MSETEGRVNERVDLRRNSPPRRTTALRVALVLVAVGSASGCSWIFVEGPPENHAELDYFTCTEGEFVPALDIVNGLLNLTMAGVAIFNEDEFDDPDDDRTTRIVTGLAWGVASGFAAASGLRKTTDCHRALRQLEERTGGPATRSGRVPSAGPLAGQPGGPDGTPAHLDESSRPPANAGATGVTPLGAIGSPPAGPRFRPPALFPLRVPGS